MLNGMGNLPFLIPKKLQDATINPQVSSSNQEFVPNAIAQISKE